MSVFNQTGQKVGIQTNKDFESDTKTSSIRLDEMFESVLKDLTTIKESVAKDDLEECAQCLAKTTICFINAQAQIWRQMELDNLPMPWGDVK